MSFKKVKTETEFQDFVKNFNRRREKLKTIVVNKKISEKEMTDFAELVQKPVTKAIESFHHPAEQKSRLHSCLSSMSKLWR